MFARFPGRAVLLPTIAALVLTATVVLSPGQAEAQSTLTVRAGDGETGYSINQFLPDSLTIQTGDTLTWDFAWFEIHTVTFGIPTGDPSAPTHPGQAVVDYSGAEFVSSGIVAGPGESFSMRFTQPGTFDYSCIIHPLQAGSVTVVDSGDTDTQQEIDAAGDAQFAAADAAIKSIAAQVDAASGAVTTKQNGTKQYTLAVGAASPAGDDAQQFFPGSISIAEGDTLLWKSAVFTPHSVTFGEYPGGDPFEKPVTRPAASYDGTGYWDSGIIGVEGYPNGSMFDMTFSEEGSFEYYCVLHADQGMVGTVVVGPGPTPVPPAAGSGIEPAGAPGTGSAPWLAALGVLVVAVGGGLVFHSTRR